VRIGAGVRSRWPRAPGGNVNSTNELISGGVGISCAALAQRQEAYTQFLLALMAWASAGRYSPVAVNRAAAARGAPALARVTGAARVPAMAAYALAP